MNVMPKDNVTPAKPPWAPFADEIDAALAEHKQVNVRLFACQPDPWPAALAHREAFGAASTLVLPPDTNPLSLAWPALTNLTGDITGLPDVVLHDLATALVRAGLRLGYLSDRERPARNLRVARKGGIQ